MLRPCTVIDLVVTGIMIPVTTRVTESGKRLKFAFWDRDQTYGSNKRQAHRQEVKRAERRVVQNGIS
jgi:hypothetical protein